MNWQPVATIIAALIGGLIATFLNIKIQKKKHINDIDINALNHALNKHLKEFEQKLIGKNSYLSEKGKNNATKEDIEEVTRKIEAIKNEFVTPLEILKWQLSKKANLHKLQAEKEFEVYSLIWNRAVKLKFAVEQLRPRADFFDSTEPAKVRWNRRYKNLIESGRNLLNEVEKQKPFYPDELFQKLNLIIQTSWTEIVDFEHSFDESGEKMHYEGYNRGHENLKKILDQMNQVCDLMRERISESD
jgi:hypothetical protein